MIKQSKSFCISSNFLSAHAPNWKIITSEFNPTLMNTRQLRLAKCFRMRNCIVITFGIFQNYIESVFQCVLAW